MACSKLAQTIETEYLTCSLCAERFSKRRNPKALSCLHTFCKPCLDRFVETTHRGARDVPCPTCNTRSKIPAGGTQHLLTNFLVFSLQDTVASKDSRTVYYCSNCEEDGSQIEATVKCLQCQHYLCEGCHSAHRRLVINKSHRVLTLEEVRSGDHDKEIREACQIMCSVHPSHPIEFYCKDDSGATCIKCNMVEHRNHNVIHLSDAANERKNKLLALMTHLKKKIESANTLSDQSKTNKANFDKQMKSVKETVKNNYKTAIDRLVQQQEAVTRKLDEANKTLTMTSQVGQENIDSSSDTLTSLYQVIQHLLEGSDAEVVSLAEQSQHRIQDILKVDLPDVPVLPVLKVTTPMVQDVKVLQLKQLWHVSLTLDSDKHYLHQLVFQQQSANIIISQLSANTNIDERSILYLDQSGNIVKRHTAPKLVRLATKPDGDIITCYIGQGMCVMSYDGTKKPFSDDQCKTHCVTCTPTHVLTSYSTSYRSDMTVTLYTLDGSKVSEFTYDTVEKQFYIPYMLADDNTNSVYISDWNDQCVYTFTYEGKLKWRYGTKGTGEGQVNGPFGMCLDRNGDIMLADADNHRVHVISPGGYFKYFLLTQEDGLSLPRDVCFNDKGNLLILEDKGGLKCYDVE